MLHSTYGSNVFFGNAFIAITSKPETSCVLMISLSNDYTIPFEDELLSNFASFQDEKEACSAVKAHIAHQTDGKLEHERGVLTYLQDEKKKMRENKPDGWQRLNKDTQECIVVTKNVISQIQKLRRQKVPIVTNQASIIAMLKSEGN